MYIQIKILMIIIIKIECSVVIDEFLQNGAHVTEYCSEIGVCKEGTHVMCTSYDPNRKMGPLCSGVENATMTEDYAALLLDLVNTIRSRAARGLAMGYEKELLPRAYGMYRVQWDSELATLAQVWANQCVIEFDNCRATKRFPDPGQLASITRFVTPNWLPLSKKHVKLYLTTPGFNKGKILYGLKSSMRSWYSTNEEIDSDIITDRNSTWADDLIRNPYLQIVDGSVTHMGCGTSAFKEYRYYTQTTYLIYNVIRLICNFSSRVRDRRGIYNTEPPTKVGYTPRCGCPPGYDEDSGCLCFESRKNQTKPCKKASKPGKLQVVVLPIVTVEDYPRAKEDSMFKNKKQLAFNKIQRPMENRRYQSNRQNEKNLSITPIFQLPLRKLKVIKQLDKIKKDVPPRKDFSKSKYLLSNYLNKRRTFNLQKVLNVGNDDKNLRRSLPIKPINSLRDNYIKRKTYNWKDKEKIDLIQRKNINSSFKVSKGKDTRLLSLLNKLENEANNINVNIKERNVLNKNIREIYTAFKNSHLINKNNIPNNEIRNKTQIKPFVDNKLIIYEDLFRNISSRQRNFKPRRNITIISSKYQNNTHIRNVVTDKGCDKHIYNKPQKDINNMDFLRSDEEYLPENKRIYYQNRINNIKRKLKAHYIDHIKSGSGLKIRPTLEASHLQFRQTLPKI